MRRVAPLIVAMLVVLEATAAAVAAEDDETVHDIVFPVVGDVSYTDTFGAPRGSDRTHEGQDIAGDKLLPLVASDDGVITTLTWPEASYGYYLRVTADDGWVYSYVHLNNDSPGTDDGDASRDDVYGPDIELGARVERGQLLGYLGDSGNAENTPPHLHFEMRDPDGNVVNPMASLDAAQRLDEPVGNEVDDGSPLPRLAGADRVATAVAVSARGWPDGAPTVVIAAGDLYAEALPASVLAADVDGPLLLVVGDDLGDEVAEELDRLGAERAIVVGSVDAGIDDALGELDVEVERVGAAGAPVDTAVAIAEEVGGAARVAVVVNRSRFADGVSAAALAAGRGWPILLADTSLVPQASVDAWRTLGVDRIVLVGGTGVLGANIESFVRERGRCGDAAGCEVERIAGDDRYGTSVAAAERSLEAGDRADGALLLGTGANYPDTLSSGPLAARLGGLALLVDGSGNGADAASTAFLEARAGEVDDVAILGGRGAVSTAAERSIRAALGLD